ncbi:hypothetical protein AZ34_02395 [Hylemonella gracilis str. Niagara R]|uniref:Antitoxin Xre/MbcA/ParS-like toxin-binding domain-containing protein n=1 Tax=Hylemonella gracilis str. Niagara R TaxID=1458275 RepID=A0A016XET3_9BURK|nr:MbcA/ParS/Xre antitoxin family protein [Hylemonella gracilis]EYC50037.1 hypothetical protein AZ34_02395 [Hylemonella gracilis str. Niagara R]
MKELSGERDDWDVDQPKAFAEEVFGTKEKSQKWMRTEVVSLGCTRPIDMMSNPEDRKSVGGVLVKIQEGFS